MKIGILVLAGLFVADVATTEYIIQNGGHEENPAMTEIADSLGEHLLLKAGVLAMIAIAVIYSNSVVKNSGSTALIFIIIWYLIVVSHNLRGII
ncbi:MAG: DUF5658 family protein [Methanomicrobium sp.]|nr:DUF5658 family protein [Methanomicrobium sp.]